MSDSHINITPQTKIGELLDSYPQFEKTLIDIVPTFKKLQNPVLRKTVAKVTSLAQAARIGGVDVGVLVSRLRREAGLSEEEYLDSRSIQKSMSQEPPIWLNSKMIVECLDARQMIEAGEQPMGKVWEILNGLVTGEIFELVTPFEPAPLIDQALEKGYQVWSGRISSDSIRTCFRQTS